MKRILVSLVAAMGVLVGLKTDAGAVPVVSLWEYFTSGGTFDGSAFDNSTGLGTVKLTFSGAGTYYAGMYVDHEIDEATNTAFNEFGSKVGAPDAGQSWEIDEPGYNPFPGTDPPVWGDIYDNFSASALDNGNGVSSVAPFDVAMALGWDFVLGSGESATALFTVGERAPNVGFYLVQTDPDSQSSIYFSSELSQGGTGEPVVPEPGTMVLLGSGLLGLAVWRRRSVRG